MFYPRTVEYALRAVVALAVRRDRRVKASELAAVTGVPTGYLSKILTRLARAGIVRGSRGTRGGFTLVPGPQELTALAVVNAIDPIQRGAAGSLAGKCQEVPLWLLHQRLDGVLAELEQSLERITIADLVDDARSRSPVGDLSCGGS